MKINIELNERQANVILNALDLYSRIGMGQVDRIEDHPVFIDADYEALREALMKLKEVSFKDLHGLGHSYGIRHEKTPEESKIAYDIFQVMRHDISWYKKPEGGITVNFNEPYVVSKEELCKCKVSD